MRVCDTCDTEKRDDDFRPFGRGRKKTCRACEGGAAVEAEPTPAPKPVQLDGLTLEVARGYGFRASAEDGQLVIEQDTDGEGAATIVLSKTELRVLAAQFAEWAAS